MRAGTLAELCKDNGITLQQLEAHLVSTSNVSRRALFDWASETAKARPLLICAIVAGSASFIKADRQGGIVESEDV
jgi:hypothetical protein